MRSPLQVLMRNSHRLQLESSSIKPMPQTPRDLTDNQWAILDSLIPQPSQRRGGRGRPWKERRTVLNGILWVLRTGAPWSELPERYPSYQTCHRRSIRGDVKNIFFPRPEVEEAFLTSSPWSPIRGFLGFGFSVRACFHLSCILTGCDNDDRFRNLTSAAVAGGNTWIYLRLVA